MKCVEPLGCLEGVAWRGGLLGDDKARVEDDNGST
jgi:hypothetical protein